MEIDPALLQGIIEGIIERTCRPPATEDEALDIVLVAIGETTDAVEVLKKC